MFNFFTNLSKKKDNNAIIIGYYTKDTHYKKVMEEHLLPSVKKFDLEYDIEEIENQGSWEKNTHLKAEFIKRKLLEYKKPVVFLDADADILKYPELFYELNNYDIGLHFLDWYKLWRKKSGDRREALSGTLFINYNKKTLRFLDEWIEENNKSTKWEQRNMEEVLKECNLNIYELPYSYITIKMRDGKVAEHMIKEEDVVILHNQVSRKYKRNLKVKPKNNKPKIKSILNVNKRKSNKIYILGGGSSLANYNLKWFRFKDTIGVNKAASYVQNLNYFITLDQSLFKKLNKNETKNLINNSTKKTFVVNFGTGVLYKNLKGTIIDKRWNLHYKLDMFDEIIESQKIEGIGYTKEDFRTGNNSGLCALQYAVIKGYKEIYLLGIDLVCKNNLSHFHGGYGESINRFSKKLDEYYEYWKKALTQLKREQPDIKVFSCSKISRLNEIIPYKELK